MPPIFECFSRFSFLAQQLILPKSEKEILEMIQVPKLKFSLRDHYQTCSNFEITSTNCSIELQSSIGVPSDIRLTHIDLYKTESDGIWYPDSCFPPVMSWCGGKTGKSSDQITGGSFFNPFYEISQSARVSYFLEPLRPDYKEMQWALMKNDDSNITANDIENRSFANQNIIPNWLSKVQFLSFSSLLTFPFLQWRKLCVSLHDRALPFSHPAVHTLIQILMYHVGPIINANSPREYLTLYILSIMASNLFQWKISFKEILCFKVGFVILRIEF
jgi:hypothetical protein